MRRETLDASLRDVRREALDASFVSGLASTRRVSCLTSHAPFRPLNSKGHVS